MSSPTPPDYERWRTQPSIIINFSPEEVALFEGDTEMDIRRRRVKARTTAWVGVLAVMVVSVPRTDGWLSIGHARDKPGKQAIVDLGPAARGEALPPAEAPFNVAPEAAHDLTREAALDVSISLDAPEELSGDAPVVTEPEIVDSNLLQEGRLAIAREAILEGRLLLTRGRYAGAVSAYRRALAANPGHSGALRGMAEAALGRGNLNKALRYARIAVARGPSHAGAHLVLGAVLRAQGSIAEADVEYGRAAKLSGKAVDRAARTLPPNPF